MTGNATLDAVIFVAIGVGVAVGAGVATLGMITFYVRPRIEKLFKPAAAAAVHDAEEAAAKKTKQTADEWLAEFGKNELDTLKKRNKEADERYDTLLKRFDQLDADEAKRAADDQRRINELDERVAQLTGEVRVLTAERDNIARERDIALRKVEAQDKEIGHLKREQERDSSRIRELEHQVAGLQARDTLMQDLKTLFVGALKPSNDTAPVVPLPVPETGESR